MKNLNTSRQLFITEFYVGLVLITFYFFQSFTQFSDSFFNTFQSGNVYLQISGFILSGAILQQWLLSSSQNAALKAKRRIRHQQVGLLLPILLLVHSTHIGYGYQVLLVAFFIIAFLSGLLNPKFTNSKNPRYYAIWNLVHVSCSSGLIIMLIFHIYIVYAYH